jgi:hypothetical protein
MSSFQYGRENNIALNAGNITTGIIRDINYGEMTASVEINSIITKNIPIHYHCEEDNTDSGLDFDSVYPDDLDEDGAYAFSEGDEVLIMFRDINNTKPLIIGFPGEAKECFKTVYLRLTIDNHVLRHGGQIFKLMYTNGNGEEVDSNQCSVRGKDEDGADTTKYQYCGPFILEGINRNMPIKICLKNSKNTEVVDPVPAIYPFEDNLTYSDDGYEEWGRDYSFRFFKEDEDGNLRHYVEMKCHLLNWIGYHISGNLSYHHSNPLNCDGSPDYTYEMRRGKVLLGIKSFEGESFEDYPKIEHDAESYTVASTNIEPWWNANWVYTNIGSTTYSEVEWIYKEYEFADFFAKLVEEEKIYNWDDEIYVENAKVLVDNIQFGLNIIKNKDYEIKEIIASERYLRPEPTNPDTLYYTEISENQRKRNGWNFDIEYSTSEVFERPPVDDFAGGNPQAGVEYAPGTGDLAGPYIFGNVKHTGSVQFLSDNFHDPPYDPQYAYLNKNWHLGINEVYTRIYDGNPDERSITWGPNGWLFKNKSMANISDLLDQERNFITIADEENPVPLEVDVSTTFVRDWGGVCITYYTTGSGFSYSPGPDQGQEDLDFEVKTISEMSDIYF